MKISKYFQHCQIDSTMMITLASKYINIELWRAYDINMLYLPFEIYKTLYKLNVLKYLTGDKDF